MFVVYELALSILCSFFYWVVSSSYGFAVIVCILDTNVLLVYAFVNISVHSMSYLLFLGSFFIKSFCLLKKKKKKNAHCVYNKSLSAHLWDVYQLQSHWSVMGVPTKRSSREEMPILSSPCVTTGHWYIVGEASTSHQRPTHGVLPSARSTGAESLAHTTGRVGR